MYQTTNTSRGCYQGRRRERENIPRGFCYFFIRNNYCRNGDHCNYSHDRQQLDVINSRNNHQNNNSNIEAPIKQDELEEILECPKFLNSGVCDQFRTCPYFHDGAECETWIECGQCKQKEYGTCNFKHRQLWKTKHHVQLMRMDPIRTPEDIVYNLYTLIGTSEKEIRAEEIVLAYAETFGEPLNTQSFNCQTIEEVLNKIPEIIIGEENIVKIINRRQGYKQKRGYEFRPTHQPPPFIFKRAKLAGGAIENESGAEDAKTETTTIVTPMQMDPEEKPKEEKE